MQPMSRLASEFVNPMFNSVISRRRSGSPQCVPVRTAYINVLTEVIYILLFKIPSYKQPSLYHHLSLFVVLLKLTLGTHLVGLKIQDPRNKPLTYARRLAPGIPGTNLPARGSEVIYEKQAHDTFTSRTSDPISPFCSSSCGVIDSSSFTSQGPLFAHLEPAPVHLRPRKILLPGKLQLRSLSPSLIAGILVDSSKYGSDSLGACRREGV